MKLRLKRVLLVLCMLACFFSLSACGQAETVEEPIDPMISMALELSLIHIFFYFKIPTTENYQLSSIRPYIRSAISRNRSCSSIVFSCSSQNPLL